MDIAELILYDNSRGLWIKIADSKLCWSREGANSPEWFLVRENPNGFWDKDGLKFRHSNGFIKWIGDDKWIERQQDWSTNFVEVSRKRSQGISRLVVSASDKFLLNNIEIIHEIGGGFFGTVYKGMWQSTTAVALKTINKQEYVNGWEEEMKLLSGLHHPNIVQYFGNYRRDGKDYIVTEFLPLGSVKDFLVQDKSISVDNILKMARGTAAGMLYLSENGIIHRDLGARNLLAKKTDDGYTAQVADFGMSRQLRGSASYESSGKVFAINWSAAEVVTSQSFSKASDVWSFAITLWEMLEYGKTPFYELGSDRETISKRIVAGEMLSQPKTCPDSLFDLMKRCWQLSPTLRPTFKQIHVELNAHLQSSPLSSSGEKGSSLPVGYYVHYTESSKSISSSNGE